MVVIVQKRQKWLGWFLRKISGYIRMVPGVLFPSFGQKQVMDTGIFIINFIILFRVGLLFPCEQVLFVLSIDSHRPEHKKKKNRAKGVYTHDCVTHHATKPTKPSQTRKFHHTTTILKRAKASGT